MQIFSRKPHCSFNQTWSRQEELANTITHFFGLMVSLIAFYFLLQKSLVTRQHLVIIATLIYGSSVAATFLISSIFHALTAPKPKELFHLLDHLLIYLMIAGTYTPFSLITLNGIWGDVLFMLIWGLAILGIIFKIIFLNRNPKLSLAFYLIMGWIGVIAIGPLFKIMPYHGLIWLISGGIFYTIGAGFYALDSMPFTHTIWHVFVILGAAAQFICIYFYVI